MARSTTLAKLGLERDGFTVSRLRKELLEAEGGDLWRRRAIAALSALGAVDFSIISLYQIGLVKHLPDPPLDIFDSDRVNAAKDAYRMGFPDGPLGMLSYAAGVWLASIGGANRAEKTLVWPILLAAKAAADAAGAAYYLRNMVAVQRKACGYCLLGAAVNFAVLGLSLPEAWRAGRRLAGAAR